MRQIFATDPIQKANQAMMTLATTGLSKVKTSDKSFNGELKKDANGKITGGKFTTTGWLTETEVEFE